MRRRTANADYKRRWREFGVLVYFAYNVKKEQGRVHLPESLKSEASGFERLTVCFCAHALPSPHLLVHIGSVCVGK